MAPDGEPRDFLDRWLRAWTGNNPAELMGFDADDVFYSDPALRNGIRGREALLGYFSKLLAANPAWEWSLLEGGNISRNEVYFDRTRLGRAIGRI
jgi:hypothetical protein